MAEPTFAGEFRIVSEERLKELEAAEDRATKLVMNGSAQLRHAREEVAALKRALEWYADRANWRGRGLVPRILAHDDRGARARKALGMG